MRILELRLREGGDRSTIATRERGYQGRPRRGDSEDAPDVLGLNIQDIESPSRSFRAETPLNFGPKVGDFPA